MRHFFYTLFFSLICCQAWAQPATALDFDGVNDYVQLPFIIDPATTNFTIEAWFKYDGITGYRSIVGQDAAPGMGRFYLGTYNNRLHSATGVGNGTFVAGVTSLVVGNWYHAAITYDGTNIKLYLNGNLEKTQAQNPEPAQGGIQIGCNRNISSQMYRGAIDEVRIWNYERCITEIQGYKDCELAGNETGLLAYYNFNQGIASGSNPTETTLLDRQTNTTTKNGTLNGPFTLTGTTSNWVDGTTNGVTGTCVSLNTPDINVSGNGISILDGDLTPQLADDTDFGNVVIGGNDIHTFTIDNDAGSADLTISNITVSGINASNFVLGGISLPVTVLAGSSTTFTVSFAPTNTSLHTATVTINSNDCDESVYDFSIQGNGVCAPNSPEIDVLGNGTSIINGDLTPQLADDTDFGDVIVGSNDMHTFTIDNTAGVGDLNLSSITISGVNAADFVLGGISLPATVVAGSATTFNITFTPAAIVLHTALVTINSNDCDEAAYSFKLQGNGIPAVSTPATALDFDGVNDYVQLPFILDPATTNFTIEAWFKYDGITGYRSIVGQDAAPGTGRFYLGTYNNRLYSATGYGNGTLVAGVTSLVVGNWYHAAITYDGTNIKLYLNGNLEKTQAQNPEPAQGGIQIGCNRNNSSQMYRGAIDEVRIWNYERTIAELQDIKDCELSGDESGLLAYYNFNQGIAASSNPTETTLFDRQTNSTPKDGVLNGPFALNGTFSNWIDDAGSGPSANNCIDISEVRGNMYAFDGVDDHIIVNGFDPAASSYSVEMWVKQNANKFVSLLHQQDGSGTGRAFFQILAGGEVRTFMGGVGTVGTTITVPNEWNHLALTYNSGTNDLKLYVNGILDAQATVVMEAANGDIIVGASKRLSLFHDGSMDELRFWNEERTQSEIRANMHLTLKGNETGLVSYYQFNNDDPTGTFEGVKDALGNNNGTTQNMATSTYIPSEVAVAAGLSDILTITGTGDFYFPNTGVTINFNTTPNGALVVSRLQSEKPTGWASVPGDVDDEYFVVWNYGSNKVPVVDAMTFESISDIQSTIPNNNIELFKRGSRDYGASWGTPLSSAYSIINHPVADVRFGNGNLTTGFSQFVIVDNSSNSGLPIEMNSFDAKRIHHTAAQLDWQTASELNNEGFYIERMLQDETSFSTIGWMEGHGTTNEIQNYTYTDNDANAGVLYYRLRQVDYDGTSSYSDIKAVAATTTAASNEVRVYPNPTKNKLMIDLRNLAAGTGSTINIRMVNALGAIVLEQQLAVPPFALLQMDQVETLNSGIYTLSVLLENGEQISKRFVKQ